MTPHVMLVDDLHWADESTLLLLAHLTAHVEDLPLLIVGTYRDVDLEVDRPFAKTLESLNRQPVVHKLALKRLPQSGVGEMLRALSGQPPPVDLVGAVYRETEGNPFFVEEVFHHLREEGKLFDANGQWRTDLSVEDLDVPEGVRLVVGRRIQRLSEEHRRLLTTAAIVGRSFDLNLMEAVAGHGADDPDAVLDALEAAEEAKLVVTVSSGRVVRWEFAHGLIRQTLQNSLSLPRRQRAHLRVADALERINAANPDRVAADLAHHLYQAGAAADPEKTVGYLTIAATKGLEAGAFEEALRQLDEALSILADAEGDMEEDPRRLADLRYQKGQALRSLGRGDEAVTAWSGALDTYEALSDDAAVAKTTRATFYVYGWAGNLEGVERVARRGLAALGSSADRERSELLAMTAFSLALRAKPGGAEMINEAVTLATEIGDPDLLGDVRQHQGWLSYAYMRPHDYGEVGEQAVASLRSRSNLWDVADVGCYLTWSRFYTGEDLDQSVKDAHELKSLAERVGHTNASWVAGWPPSLRALMTTGRLQTFEAFARDDVEFCRQAGLGWRFLALVFHGWALFWRGEWRAACEVFQESVDLEPAGSFWNGMAASALLFSDVCMGSPDAAERVGDDKVAFEQLGNEVFLGSWEQLLNVVETLGRLGERQQVGELYPVVLRGMKSGMVVSVQARLWEVAAGIAAAGAERWSEAQQHFETALRQAHELPHKIAQPEVRRWYAWMLIDRDQPGDKEKAKTLLGEAIEMYKTLGMPKHIELAEALSPKS